MREHEREFDPTAYRPVPRDTSTSRSATVPVTAPTTDIWVERKERTMGFRVQLHSTANLDEAQNALAQYRGRLDSLEIEAGRLDMVFDAPYYKIRLGDFLVKGDADNMAGTLRDAGLPEAWVVRDNVYRVIRERKKR